MKSLLNDFWGGVVLGYFVGVMMMVILGRIIINEITKKRKAKTSMKALIHFETDYEATVRVANEFAASELARQSGGYIFNWKPEDEYFETPVLSVDDARICLKNLERNE